MDGVGLGPNDPGTNPFSIVPMPNLEALLGGKKLLRSSAPLENGKASLVALDAHMGVADLPQSATGQGTLVTGINLPASIGKHYGPKPNPEIAKIIQENTIFGSLNSMGLKSALLNAYPEPYFEGIRSGKRLYSAIPLAVTSGGIALKTSDDLFAGQAFSADFTGQGWRQQLGYTETPLKSPHEAGAQLGRVAMDYDFAFFEYWPSDFAGHKQDWDSARSQLIVFDGVLGGLVEAWDHSRGLIFITSDHGNLEDLGTRRHTANAVPGLVIGSLELRAKFISNLQTLADVTPAILGMYV